MNWHYMYKKVKKSSKLDYWFKSGVMTNQAKMRGEFKCVNINFLHFFNIKKAMGCVMLKSMSTNAMHFFSQVFFFSNMLFF